MSSQVHPEHEIELPPAFEAFEAGSLPHTGTAGPLFPHPHAVNFNEQPPRQLPPPFNPPVNTQLPDVPSWNYQQPQPPQTDALYPLAAMRTRAMNSRGRRPIVLKVAGGKPIDSKLASTIYGAIALSCIVMICLNFVFGHIAFILAGR
jgi:hypothetical protein